MSRLISASVSVSSVGEMEGLVIVAAEETALPCSFNSTGSEEVEVGVTWIENWVRTECQLALMV